MKLNNIPLELDNRISDIADIKTVITADENDVGKMGYFANSIHLFKNLEGRDGIKYGKLIYLSDLDYGGDKSDKCFVCSNQWAYRYFIPESLLKQKEPKKYRPYSLEEFIGDINLGLGPWIRMRPVGTNKECKFLYTGYQKTEMDEYICLGCFQFDFVSLFQNYEICINGEWQPFGKECEE